MKLFVAIVQSLVIALWAWFIFDITAKGYRDLASLDTSTLAQRYMTEVTSKKDGGDKPKYASLADATAQAEKDITTGKNLLNAGTDKIGFYRIAFILGSAICGLIGWFFAYFCITITTKPFDAIFDSLLQSYVRYYGGATVFTTGVCFSLIFFAGKPLIKYI